MVLEQLMVAFSLMQNPCCEYRYPKTAVSSVSILPNNTDYKKTNIAVEREVEEYKERINHYLALGEDAFKSAWDVALESYKTKSLDVLLYFKSVVSDLTNLSSEAQGYYAEASELLASISAFEGSLDSISDKGNNLIWGISCREAERANSLSGIKTHFVVLSKGQEFALSYHDFGAIKDFALCDPLHNSYSKNRIALANYVEASLYSLRAELGIKCINHSNYSVFQGLYGYRLESEPIKDMLHVISSSYFAVPHIRELEHTLSLINPNTIETLAVLTCRTPEQVKKDIAKISKMVKRNGKGNGKKR